MKINYLLVLIFLLFSQLTFAADCDYIPLNNRIDELESQNFFLQQINNTYQILLPNYLGLNNSYNNLIKDYSLVKSERDIFESKYLDSSLDNIDVGDFILYMENIENHYGSINQSISTQINQVNNIRNWTIGINIAFSFALISITLIFYKRIKNYISIKFSEITKINIKNETKKKGK